MLQRGHQEPVFPHVFAQLLQSSSFLRLREGMLNFRFSSLNTQSSRRQRESFPEFPAKVSFYLQALNRWFDHLWVNHCDQRNRTCDCFHPDSCVLPALATSSKHKGQKSCNKDIMLDINYTLVKKKERKKGSCERKPSCWKAKTHMYHMRVPETF